MSNATEAIVPVALPKSHIVDNFLIEKPVCSPSYKNIKISLSKKGNVADKKALSDAGMKVGKVNSALEKHFQKVGATMADEWKAKAGSRGASVLAAYK